MTESPNDFFKYRNMSGVVHFNWGKCAVGFRTPPLASGVAPDSPNLIYAAALWVVLAARNGLLKSGGDKGRAFRTGLAQQRATLPRDKRTSVCSSIIDDIYK